MIKWLSQFRIIGIVGVIKPSSFFHIKKPTHFLAKLEGGTSVEVFSDITVVNQWVEYTFDFSGAVGNLNTSLVLFFNATEVDGTPQDIYHIDDLRFEPQ